MSSSLKERLQKNEPLLAPGVYDALTALLAEQAGFEALYLSGASVAYTQLGRPDLGFVGLDQIADCVRRIRERVSLPVLVDADTGFGNALHVQHVVRLLERMGASAIQLEDQSFPKRCGHLNGKTLIEAQEMAGKVRAAVDARLSDQTLIIARTDAIAVEGIDAALERSELYLRAGADILFVEAPRSVDEMRRVSGMFATRVPLLANMVEGGRTPIQTRDELFALGFRIVISPGAMVRAFVHMADEFLASLRENGSTQPHAGRMLDFQTLNSRLGLDELKKLDSRYASTVSQR